MPTGGWSRSHYNAKDSEWGVGAGRVVGGSRWWDQGMQVYTKDSKWGAWVMPGWVRGFAWQGMRMQAGYRWSLSAGDLLYGQLGDGPDRMHDTEDSDWVVPLGNGRGVGVWGSAG